MESIRMEISLESTLPILTLPLIWSWPSVIGSALMAISWELKGTDIRPVPQNIISIANGKKAYVFVLNYYWIMWGAYYLFGKCGFGFINQKVCLNNLAGIDIEARIVL